MDQKEAAYILRSLLEFEFGEENVTDLRVHNSNGVISFQGTVVIDENGEENE